jgi:predicted 3-demethylubiquinone-9 3-methyltransferase (glyoxalase superfamily)
MPKISPFLWFDDNAEEAVNFYISLFPNSKIVQTSRYSDAGPGPKGRVMTIGFELAGQSFTALNGGPSRTFTEAISFVVNCEDQAEIDRYWDRIERAGGKPQACGWITDKYGLSWQIVPAILPQLMKSSDPEKAKRVMAALLKMIKLDIETLKKA